MNRAGFGEEELLLRYRESVAALPLIPAEQWAMGSAPLVWWPHLERSMCAFEDLNCAELLSSAKTTS